MNDIPMFIVSFRRIDYQIGPVVESYTWKVPAGLQDRIQEIAQMVAEGQNAELVDVNEVELTTEEF